MSNSTNNPSGDTDFLLGAVIGGGAAFAILGLSCLVRRCIEKLSGRRVDSSPDTESPLDPIDQEWMRAIVIYGAEHRPSSAESLSGPRRMQSSSSGSGPRSTSSSQRGPSDSDLLSSPTDQPSAGESEPRLSTFRRQEAVDRGSLRSSQSGGRSTDESGPQMAPSNRPRSSLTTQSSSSDAEPRNDPPLTEDRSRSEYEDIFTGMLPQDFRLPSNQSPVSARVDFIRSTMDKMMKKAIPPSHRLGRTDDMEMGTMRPVAEEESRSGPSSAD